MISLEKIKKAHEAISPYINRTPLILSNYLSKNRIVKLKLESLQITNSFKLRGATNKLLSLNNEQKQKGVIAVSTGNHGKGCLLYTSPSPRDGLLSRMPSSA